MLRWSACSAGVLAVALVLVQLAAPRDAGAPVEGHRVVRAFPHDPRAFTQGLEYRDGVLYEATGLEGSSTVRRVKLETGETLQQVSLSPRYFGEGITVLKDSILQLTWRHGVGFIYSREKLQLLRNFQYPGEGWGLANDGERIYMSDGTAQIRVWDSKTLAEQRRISVRDGGRPVQFLNELEWVRGEIWANVWQSDRIARISPLDGHVISWIDLTGILAKNGGSSLPVDVLNGIAFDAVGNRIFVTGKLWPKLFEIAVAKRR